MAGQTNNIVIFGGSSGVGLAVAKLALTALADPNIVLVSSSQDKLKAALDSISTDAPNNATVLASIAADLSDYETQYTVIKATLHEAVTTHFQGKKIDHVIWTAGDIRAPRPEDILSNADLIQGQTTRILGPIAVGAFAKEFMNDSKDSSIVLTSGVLVYRPIKSYARMTSISGGLESAVRSMSVSLAPIRVNGIILGAIKTPLLQRMAPEGSEIEKQYAARALTGTIGEAHEAAEAYVFMMKCGFVTGTMLPVDGGSLLT